MAEQRRLLILDDEVMVARLMALAAERLGFQVKTTSNFDDMKGLVQDWCPSHLAIDLLMPGKDGVEVLRELAQVGCAAAIILTSGLGAQTLETARQTGLELGLNIAGILPKPFSIAQLRSLLDAVPPTNTVTYLPGP